MKLSDYVADFLVKRGVRHLFLLPGGACMHLCDSVGRRSELDYVACLHEQGCAFATEAYAEYANEVGVCLVTAGPGGTNALTGVACAWIESAPCVFISGQAKRADLIGDRGLRSMGPQEVDIVSMVRPVTKSAVRLMDPTRIRYELEQAFYLAQEGRKGPVWIDIPLDVQASQVEPEELEPFVAPPTKLALAPGAFAATITAFLRSRRPLIYAGNGVRTAGTENVFRELVRLFNVPVLLTWKAADLLEETHPCYVGRPGAIGQRAANFAQQTCDWLLVLGARLDLPSTAFCHANFAPLAHKTFVDVDSAELGKFSGRIDCAVLANLSEALPQLAADLTKVARPNFDAWRERCHSWVKRYPVVLPEYWKARDFVSTYVLIELLAELANETDVIVPGSSGPCSDILMQAWKVKRGQRILNAPGLGAMGTGLPATIGACLASGGKRVINVNGDGGFQLNIQELETVRRLNLPIKYFVLDNGGYRSIVAMQRNHFEGRLVASDASSRLTLPDTVRVADAYGIPSCRVETHVQLRAVVERVLAAPGPMVCVVKTSPDEQTSPKCVSEVRADGTVVSNPMEDMWPFLERAEFAAVMGNLDKI
jgi:acetolactate synthase I/II/III large subunit